MELDRADDARARYQAAVERMPSHVPALIGVTDFALAKGEWARASHAAERAGQALRDNAAKARYFLVAGALAQDRLEDPEERINRAQIALRARRSPPIRARRSLRAPRALARTRRATSPRSPKSTSAASRSRPTAASRWRCTSCWRASPATSSTIATARAPSSRRCWRRIRRTPTRCRRSPICSSKTRSGPRPPRRSSAAPAPRSRAPRSRTSSSSSASSTRSTCPIPSAPSPRSRASCRSRPTTSSRSSTCRTCTQGVGVEGRAAGDAAPGRPRARSAQARRPPAPRRQDLRGGLQGRAPRARGAARRARDRSACICRRSASWPSSSIASRTCSRCACTSIAPRPACASSSTATRWIRRRTTRCSRSSCWRRAPDRAAFAAGTLEWLGAADADEKAHARAS